VYGKELKDDFTSIVDRLLAADGAHSTASISVPGAALTAASTAAPGATPVAATTAAPDATADVASR
jgi:hypothetical protein